MKPAKLFSVIVFVVIGIYGAIGLYFLPLAGFEGDLTRVAKLPESLFGWTRLQPSLEPELFKSASWQEADVLVIGDSFSEPRVWQTVLVKQGLRVRTEHWTSVRGVCEDFYPWLRAQGFKGKQVIFEVVERNIEAGLPNSVACKQQVYHPNINADKLRVPPVTSRKESDLSGKLSIALETRLNINKYGALSQNSDLKTWDIPGGVRLERMANGCELFSHKNCQDVLFYASDRVVDLNKDLLDSVQILNSRVGDITPIWVFMPDKSTVFLHNDKQFWNEAESRFMAPNVLKVMRQAVDEKIVDLYPANNSHLSTRGYLLLGEAVYQSLLTTLSVKQHELKSEASH
jgi:hypothetical protein